MENLPEDLDVQSTLNLLDEAKSGNDRAIAMKRLRSTAQLPGTGS